MHDIFLPGFKGLLEAFYVQEKIMQKMLPGLYTVFVCRFVGLIMADRMRIEAEFNMHNGLCRQMVYHPVRQYDPLPDAIAIVGHLFSRRQRHSRPHGRRNPLGLQR